MEVHNRADLRLSLHAAAEYKHPSCSHFGVLFRGVWPTAALFLDIIFFTINVLHLLTAAPHSDVVLVYTSATC